MNMIEVQVSRVRFCKKRQGSRRTGKGKLPKRFLSARDRISGVREKMPHTVTGWWSAIIIGKRIA